MDLPEVGLLARQLIEKHGLNGWAFRFNKNKRRLGVCRQDEKCIELSEHYVMRNSDAHVLDTILHEIAHALVGTEHGHDHVWKKMCLKIGCSPTSCSATADMPEGYWQARCPGCYTTFARHRRPKRVRGRYCVDCGPEMGRLVFNDVRVMPQQRKVEKLPEATPKQLFLRLFG
jgi:predicted SprT family Zn-dependent metalloprotease